MTPPPAKPATPPDDDDFGAGIIETPRPPKRAVDPFEAPTQESRIDRAPPARAPKPPAAEPEDDGFGAGII